ncbi:3-beta-hydroxysteroid sulfotransferase-like [Tropilaelaps mercedesae]|uniref:3-beta-hydroxysteroid sulfotransferase-like n=1 Tax=Tropilaelaps mercedesae TaxID=418985 RepID=A0A1V9XCU8_9ACAR|nr:3-beta-hydroxysteroid sulfotransferase-like [Tropilaelaps mercedesae]
MNDTEVTNDTKKSMEYLLDEYERASQTVDGLYVPKRFPTENVKSGMGYRARDGDVAIITYPKSGTTWTQYIVSNLLYYDQVNRDNESTPLHLCPFIESDGINILKLGGCHKAHLVFDVKRFNPRAKYIVVMRNPRDVCVSYYYHCMTLLPGTQVKPKGFFFPAFARLFISNKIWYGDYFEHVRSWLEGPTATGATGDNILYVIYEKMKANPRQELIRMANFIGGEAAERVKDEKIVDVVLSRTSLKSMKETLNPVMREHQRNVRTAEETGSIIDNFEFVRKGQVGDWKNHFTPDISATFDAWIHANPENEKIMKLFEI